MYVFYVCTFLIFLLSDYNSITVLNNPSQLRYMTQLTVSTLCVVFLQAARKLAVTEVDLERAEARLEAAEA